jgi:hypothetical protein
MKMKLNKGKTPKKYESKSLKRSKTAIKLIRGGGCNAPDVVSQYINPPGSVMSAGLEGTTNIFHQKKPELQKNLFQTNLNNP